jgi:hypothetical protein
VQNPTYTAPANAGDSDLIITLTVNATCDGPSPLGDSDATTLSVTGPLLFLDVPPDHWAYDEIMACARCDIVSGYPDHYYHPEWPVSRDQMAAYVSRAVAGGDEAVPGGPDEATFPDVPADHWAYRYVEYAVARSIVQGYGDGNYHPDWTLTRGQMSVFMARAIADPTGEEGLAGYDPPDTPTYDDVPSDYWCYRHVEYLAARGVVLGYPDGGYAPTAQVTRDQMAVYIARAFDLLVLGESSTSDAAAIPTPLSPANSG